MTSVINASFLKFTRRAEVVDRSHLVETFVDAGPLMTLLQSRDHQVVYGRRGTGKTHALSYLAEERRQQGEVTAYIDLRTIGSSGGIYSDPNLPLSERATRLALDTLAAIHDKLVDHVLTEELNLAQLGPLLDEFADAVTEVSVEGTVEREREVAEEAKEAKETSFGVKASPPARLGLDVSRTTHSSSALTDRLRQSEVGVARHRIHFGRVGAVLIKLSEAIGRQVWVVLDEWSSIPLDLQPYLGDLLRRTILPAPGYTVKIGAIEQRSRFRLPTEEGDYVGLELGADVTADVNLDDFMVFENDAQRAKVFFTDLLFKHFASVAPPHEDASLPVDGSELVQRAFTQVTAFDEFIRASEGVPRDAINIVGLAAQKALSDSISVAHIRTAARTWYHRDKEAAVSASPASHTLLHWVIDRVIGERRARAFLLRSDISDTLIDSLFDARVLHILKKSISARDQPGIRYDAYKLDYGCYVDLISTAKAPLGLFPVDNEGEDETAFVEVPPDDYRSIRRAILDLKTFYEATGGTEKTGRGIAIEHHV